MTIHCDRTTGAVVNRATLVIALSMQKLPHGITAEVRKVTPELAKTWLGTTEKNRTFRKSRVAQYAADMKAGRWQLNGEAIKFDKNGHLLNGQHRLHAVVRADTTVPMLVISGLDPETRTTMDSGLVAKNWDWSEIPYGREVSSICASLVLMRYPTLGRALSRSEMELTYQMLGPELIQYVVRRMRPGIAGRAPLRAGAVLLHRAEAADVPAVPRPAGPTAAPLRPACRDPDRDAARARARPSSRAVAHPRAVII